MTTSVLDPAELSSSKAPLSSTRAAALLPLRILVTLYVEVFRRIPFLVTLFIVMFAIQVVSRQISLFTIAIISICMLSTAFLSEIIRAGMESIPRQQVEAAETLNFGFWRTQLRVVLPQSWKVILPPAFAFMVMFIKDTSLVSQIGVVELTYRGRELNNMGFSGIFVFGIIAILYFVMSYPLSKLGERLELKLIRRRRASPGN